MLFRCSPSLWPRSYAVCGFEQRAVYPQCLLPLVVHRVVGRPAVTGAAESAARWLGLTRLFGSPVLTLATRS